MGSALGIQTGLRRTGHSSIAFKRTAFKQTASKRTVLPRGVCRRRSRNMLRYVVVLLRRCHLTRTRHHPMAFTEAGHRPTLATGSGYIALTLECQQFLWIQGAFANFRISVLCAFRCDNLHHRELFGANGGSTDGPPAIPRHPWMA